MTHLSEKNPALCEPTGKLSLRTVAMPADTNANGDIFGGWLVSRMDMAVGIEARLHSRGRVVTVAIDQLVFLERVYVGDTVSCYTELVHVGRTSMKFKVEVWTISFLTHTCPKKAAEGVFTFVAIDDNGKPHPVNRD